MWLLWQHNYQDVLGYYIIHLLEKDFLAYF